jgi:hypothetical protein
VAGVPGVLDFRRDVQPVLDRHCTRCHNGDRPEGRGLDLTSAPDAKEKNWPRSYAALTRRRAGGKYSAGEPLYVAFAPNAAGNYPPRSLGTGDSRLMKFLDGSHYDARLAQAEHDTVRLWIEAGATYYGNYRAYQNWTNQMVRYGVVPANGPKGALDPFEMEQRYWESLWWRPHGK